MQVAPHELYQLTMKFTINSQIRDLMFLASGLRVVRRGACFVDSEGRIRIPFAAVTEQ